MPSQSKFSTFPSPCAQQTNLLPPTSKFPLPETLTATNFATSNVDLRELFPLAWYATTMKGLATLMMALPLDWPDALEAARETLPTPTAMTTLEDIFLRGTVRTLPRGIQDITRVRTRRSALKRLQKVLPACTLGSLDEACVQALVSSYREKQQKLPAPMLSADISELRFTLDAARKEAGLPALKRPSFEERPRQRVGRPSQRQVATLAEVTRLMRTAETWMQAFLALTVATPAPQKYLMELRREALDLDHQRMTLDTATTRGPSGLPGRMVYGLPDWCMDSLRSVFPDIESWNIKRLLFPSHADPQSLRGDVSHVFRTLARKSDCIGVTLSDIRRLSQTIHVRAPRAVRRGTATARLETGKAIADQALAEAQASYAALVVQTWKVLDQPPWPPGRVSRRALKYLKAEETEGGKRGAL